MRINRRCGFVSSIVLAVLAFLAGAPSALSQALTMVQSGARSAGSSAAGFNGDFGSATTVSLDNPSFIVFDSNGNQFISDTLNNCVRKIDTSGNMTTLAGLAVSGQSDTCNTSLNSSPTPTQGLFQPTGLAIDSSNRLYIADSKHNCVRAMTSGFSGVANLTTVAGTCGSSPTASVTPAPDGLAVDAASNLYISLQDSASATLVYQVVEHTAAAVATNVCLVAGAASANVSAQCPGIANGVVLAQPSGLAINILGDLFIADTANSCVRQVAGLASGAATQATAVGQCINDGSGTSATAIHNPYGIVVSPMQSLLISESNPNNIVSFVPGSSAVNLVAGLPSGIAGSYDSTQDGKSALSVPLNGARGLAFDSVAHLFAADSLNNIVRQLSTNLHFPNTPIGSPSAIQPITFSVNQAVNLTSSTGSDFSIASTTCVGSLTPSSPGSAPTTCQVFVRFTPTRPGLRRSALEIGDSISGSTIFMGLQAVGTGPLAIFTPGTATSVATGLVTPLSITTDAGGNAYVLETQTASGIPDLRVIPANGGNTSVLGTGPGLLTPSALASDAAGNWFVADSTRGTISRYGADGSVNSNYITGLDTPTSIYLDIFNNLFIAQAGSSHNVIESYATGVRRVIAGSGSNIAADGVTAVSAGLVSPSAITVDLNGILYIADQGGHRVYAVDNAGIIHIAAGNGTTNTTVPGQALGTALIAPTSLAVDAAGDVYVADQAAGIIYVVYSSSNHGASDIAEVISTSAPGVPNGPLNIALDGSSNLFISNTAASTVTKLSYPNPTLNFGSVELNTTSLVILQDITNVGNANINITNQIGTSDSHFALDFNTTTCGTSILTGSVCTVGFTFTPTVKTAYNATSIVNSNSFNTPQPITLVGTGVHVVELTITLPAETEVYGQSFPETVTVGGYTTLPTGTITFTAAGRTLCTLSGMASGPTTVCNAAPSGLPVGTYTVTFNYSGDSNYSPAAGTTTLTVTAAPLTEIVNNASRAYGAANPAFSGTLTGTAPGDTFLVSFATTATTTSPVGNYPITATLTPVDSTSFSNYTVTNTPGVLSVTQAAVVITANNATRLYGTPNPAFTGTITGPVNGDTIAVTYLTTANISSPVGNYPIVPSVSSSYPNYNITVHNGTLSITTNGNSLLIKVHSAARVYGAPNPAFSGDVTGVLPGDNIVVTFSTTATQASSAGNYPIGASISGTSAANYIATINVGTLDITQASTTTTLATSATPAQSGSNVTFTAHVTASSGTASGIVTFFDGTVMLGNATLNTVNGNATFTTNTLSVGSHNISGAFQANTNFTTSAASVTQVVTQATGGFTISANPPNPYVRGAATTVFQVTVTSNGAFSGPIALTCAGLPSDTGCNFTSPTVNLSAGSSVTTTMTVVNTAADAKLQTPALPNDIAPLTVAAVLPGELIGLGVLFVGLRRRKVLGTQKMRLLLMIVFTLGILGLVGCGCPNTAFKTYTINITGTSLSFPAPAQTTSVVLSVGQQ